LAWPVNRSQLSEVLVCATDVCAIVNPMATAPSAAAMLLSFMIAPSY
jgi:hypothetical protein